MQILMKLSHILHSICSMITLPSPGVQWHLNILLCISLAAYVGSQIGSVTVHHFSPLLKPESPSVLTIPAESTYAIVRMF